MTRLVAIGSATYFILTRYQRSKHRRLGGGRLHGSGFGSPALASTAPILQRFMPGKVTEGFLALAIHPPIEGASSRNEHCHNEARTHDVDRHLSKRRKWNVAP